MRMAADEQGIYLWDSVCSAEFFAKANQADVDAWFFCGIYRMY